MDEIDYALRASLSGAFIGVIFGFFAFYNDFCVRTLIIAKTVLERQKQMRQWLPAILISIIGIQYLLLAKEMDLSGSIYRLNVLNPITLLVGGLMFGTGMVMTRGCLARHLVLSGSGNIRSWIVVILAGFGSYLASGGVFAYFRVGLSRAWAIDISGKDFSLYVLGFAIFLVLFCLFYLRKAILKDKQSFKDLAIGSILGALVVASFWVTAFYGFDEFDPRAAESLRFTLPLGDSLIYLMTFTGAKLNFAVALMGGVIIGSLLASISQKRFEWRSFENPRASLRYIGGAFLMGIGGVLSLGCTIGQGLVGLASLSASAPIAIIAIIIGARCTNYFIVAKYPT